MILYKAGEVKRLESRVYLKRLQKTRCCTVQ